MESNETPSGRNAVRAEEPSPAAAGSEPRMRDLLGAFAAVADAVTPDSLQGMAHAVEEFGQMADRLNQPDVLDLVDAIARRAKELTNLVDRVARLESGGALDRVEQILRLMNAALDVLTPEIVSSLARAAVQAAELADAFAQSDVSRRLPGALTATDAVLKRPPAPTRGAVRTLLGAARDPDIRTGLETALALFRIFGSSMGTKG